jgi:hypothetical protein
MDIPALRLAWVVAPLCPLLSGWGVLTGADRVAQGDGVSLPFACLSAGGDRAVACVRSRPAYYVCFSAEVGGLPDAGGGVTPLRPLFGGWVV